MKNVDRTFECIVKAFNYFCDQFGDYQYDSLSICQTDFENGGMEYPALVFVGKDQNYTDYLYSCVHEIAHEWWYATVGNDQINESFLDEGLAEYSTMSFFREFKDFQIDGDSLIKMAKNAYTSCFLALTKLGISNPCGFDKSIYQFTSQYEYVNTAYNKGASMFFDIEDELKVDKMITLLKKYYNDNKNKLVTLKSFKETFRQANKVIQSYCG